MKIGLTILATAAILLPAAAVAQDTQPTTTPPATAQSRAPGQAGTTPGQEQTSPGQASDLTPAVEGTTPSGQTTGKAEATAATTATAKVTKADVKAGAPIFDTNGDSVGKVESISAKGAVVNTGKVKVTVPISSLAKSEKGLVIAMTKSQIEAAAKKSS